MPTPYVQKLAKEHGMSVGEAESKWSDAKAEAKKQGKGDNYAYITSIFKSMMGEKSTAGTVMKKSVLAKIDAVLATREKPSAEDVKLVERVLGIKLELATSKIAFYYHHGDLTEQAAAAEHKRIIAAAQAAGWNQVRIMGWSPKNERTSLMIVFRNRFMLPSGASVEIESGGFYHQPDGCGVHLLLVNY